MGFFGLSLLLKIHVFFFLSVPFYSVLIVLLKCFFKHEDLSIYCSNWHSKTLVKILNEMELLVLEKIASKLKRFSHNNKNMQCGPFKNSYFLSRHNLLQAHKKLTFKLGITFPLENNCQFYTQQILFYKLHIKIIIML